MSSPANNWLNGPEDYDHDYRERRVQFQLAFERFYQTYGCSPDDDSVTDAQRIAFWESSWQICEGNLTANTDEKISAESREQCLRCMKDRGVSITTSEGSDVQVNILRASKVESGNNQEMTVSKTSSTTTDNGAAQIPINTGFSMPTPVSDKSSPSSSPISQEDAKERGPLDISKGKHTTEEQLVSKDESTSEPWSDVMQTTPKDEAEVNKYLSKRLQHWKDKLATKKHPSPINEDEQSLPSDILDFNASMLDREDYDEMLHSAATNKQRDKIVSNSTIEKVSSSEQSTAINALLYGLNVLKTASPIQQHEMVTSLLHPKVRKMQPSLAFEMNALLLELDTQKLLTMSADEDALHVKAKKVARAWGVELSSLEDGPSGLAW
ncbi:hypothetical protein E4T50_03957 [Aureobasidium sp. EXF-12298]|nr:hypothetical protein E4T50_03957 [Aureobasidium sp. EXF-12298]KAI4763655.1 hypothetical protein E4T51_03369 [Aureobasidium sp. EXF-12344]KAI4780711.1 hypothetical protein E4T52_04416 [Aureobasidium sp. EXF-3400]